MRIVTALALLFTAALAGCYPAGPEFSIVAGSENRVLEPVVQEFCKKKGAKCTFKYQGSLDIGFALRPGEGALAEDAVWPAASIWIDIFDTARKVKHLKSVAQMPVVLALRRSKAEALGFVGKPVTTKDILAAVEAGKLKFLMSSATQSNSGAAAYLAMLAAGLGTQDVLQMADLEKESVRNTVRALLKGVTRSAGSSGWLAELYEDADGKGENFDGMWNYEAVIKETNDSLRSRGRELLYAIYPADGVAVADSPLGFVERGRGKEVEAFFLALQEHLLNAASQKRIADTGRRVALGRAEMLKGEPQTNVDPSRAITAIRLPEPAVVTRALNLYQEALRRPSLTALCLDVSGSMAGNGGEKQLLDAMRFLLTPEQTRDFLVQWTPADEIIVIPFNDRVPWVKRASGDALEQAALLESVLALRAGGGTDMYGCAIRALQAMQPTLDKDTHLPAIVIMTDGQSQGAAAELERRWSVQRKIPIFGVLFGEQADKSQLERLAKLTNGRVFDGSKSLTEAFRAMRGYN